MADEKENEMKNKDRLVRTQRNALTGTVYHFYDVRDGSDLFEGLDEGDRYVVAIMETGEWKGFPRRNTSPNSAIVNMHPYAKWAQSEVRIMRVKDLADRMSVLVNHILNEDIAVEVVEMNVERMIHLSEKNDKDGEEE